MPNRIVAATVVFLALLPLLSGMALYATARQPGRAFSLTARMGDDSRIDLTINRCSAWQPGRLLLLRTDFNHNDQLTNTRTTVLLGSRIAPLCP